MTLQDIDSAICFVSLKHDIILAYDSKNRRNINKVKDLEQEFLYLRHKACRAEVSQDKDKLRLIRRKLQRIVRKHSKLTSRMIKLEVRRSQAAYDSFNTYNTDMLLYSHATRESD